MLAAQETKIVNLGNFITNLLRFLKRENEEVKIILHSITENRTILSEDYSEKNPILEKKAWENIILWLENKGKNFSMDIGGQMNGAVAVHKDFQKIGCSIFGLPNFIENTFTSIKILEFYTKVEFEKTLNNLEKEGAPLPKEELLEMNKGCNIR